MQYNRVKFNATIVTDGAQGSIVPGTPVTGYRIPSPPLWLYTANTISKKGQHNYLLEDGTGAWELGYITVSVDNGASTRTVTESSDSGNPVFSVGSTNLVCSMVSTLDGVWAGGDYAAGFAPKARNMSLAAGYGASTGHDVYHAIAVGMGAYAHKDDSIALGTGAVSYKENEVALGSSLDAIFRVIPMKWEGDNTSQLAFVTSGVSTDMNLATWDAIMVTRRDGVFRVTGTIIAWNESTGKSAATMKVVNVDYSVWVNATTSVTTTIGTPSFTVVAAGGSAPAITFSVNATTGALQASTAGADYLMATALLQIYDFQTTRSGQYGPELV